MSHWLVCSTLINDYAVYLSGWNPGVLYNGFALPSARLVSTKVITTDVITVDPDFTHMVMLWGQFHDHDITFIPTVGVSCAGVCENIAPCFPIPIPDDDPRINTVECLPFVRSSATCNDGLSEIRQQVNSITSFTDASNVYGSNEALAMDLQDLTDDLGNLRTGIMSDAGKPYLPFDHANEECVQVPGADVVPCFLAGDKRSNEHIALTSMHTVWMREHNRMAAELRSLNPGLNGDTIYHETRKILSSMMQIITYEEFLPKVIGPGGMAIIGSYDGYKQDKDPTILNSFSTAAYRYGHGQIRTVTHRTG